MANYVKLPGRIKQLKRSGYPDIPLTKADELALMEGCYFDAKAGWKAVDYIEFYCKPSKGQYAGKPLQLLPWQSEQLLVPVFGWKRANGLRRIQKSSTFIAKKNGKALALDTLIPTIDGFKPMSEIRVGDILFDEHGNQCNVTFESEVFENRRCVEIVFKSGQKVVCDFEHEWVLKRGASTGNDRKMTSEMLLRGFEKGARYSVSIAEGIKPPKKDLPIPPYSLGFWLGDGHSAGARITVGHDDMDTILSVIHSENIPTTRNETKRQLNCNNYSLSDGKKGKNKEGFVFHVELGKLNLRKNKHIPEQYFWASYEDRLELLRGLLDSDGSCTPRGQIEFCSIKEGLAKDVYRLVRSLGFKPSLKIGKAKIKGRFISNKYRICFYADRSTPVFHLERKYSRQKNTFRPSAKIRKGTGFYYPKTRSSNEYIQLVREVPSVPTKCIQVDSPSHLYLCTEHFIPTHNTTLMAGVASYLCDPLGDGELGAEIYLCATTKDQATFIFKETAAMIEASPVLEKRFTVVRSTKAIDTKDRRSWIKAIASEANSAEGINAHGMVLDEMHAWTDTEFYGSIKFAGSGRQQPLTFIISTAGADIHSIGGVEYEYAKGIISGNNDDIAVWPLIFEADPSDDPSSPETWRKANPSLGYTVSMEAFEKDYKECKTKGGKDWNDFRRYRLNIWGGAEAPYLNIAAWDSGIRDFQEEDMRGQECYAGLDISSKEDLTSLCLCFPVEDGYRFLWRHWVPEDKIKEKLERSDKSYFNWVQRGDLFKVPGARIEQELIIQQIKDDFRDFDIRGFAVESWNAQGVLDELTKLIEEPIEVTPSYRHYSEPTKEFKAHVEAGQIYHKGSPLIRWMMENLHIKENNFLDVMPMKKDRKRKYKIDGCISAILAFKLALIARKEAEFVSIYDSDEGSIIL